MQAVDLNVGRIVGEEEDRTVILVVGVQDLGPREAVPPGLAIAVENARAVDLDVPLPLRSVYSPMSGNQEGETHFPPQTQKVMLFWKG